MSQLASLQTKMRWLRGSRGFSIDTFGLAATLALFGPGMLHYWTVSFSPDRSNDDSRQVTWPLLRYGDPPLFTTDPIADYYIDTHLPAGYQAVMRALAGTIDAVPLSTMAGHLSFIVAIVFAFLIGRSLGGKLGGWICIALLLASDELFAWTAGGLPRAAGTAVMFVALYGFLCDRSRYTASATILGALFWYPVAVSAGVLYAVQCLGPRPFFGWQDGKVLGKRAFSVFLVACATIACAAPKILFQSQWGSVVTNTSSAWPEAGEGGRLARRDQLGRVGPTETLVRVFKGSFVNQQAPWLRRPQFLRDLKGKLAIALWLLQLGGLIFLSRSCPIARRLLGALAVSISLYVAAILVAPWLYAASRFIIVFFPWIGIFAFVYLGHKIAISLAHSRTLGVSSVPAQLIPAVLTIFLLGGRPLEQGINIRIGPFERQTLDFISQLPTTALIAGWPDGIADNIPLFARRRVLLSLETHLPFHETHLRNTRAKANAIIDAWFSADGRSLKSLVDRYGVTHFMIDKRRRADPSLSYFRPFDRYINMKRDDLHGRVRWIETPPQTSVVFENEHFVIIDLGVLG